MPVEFERITYRYNRRAGEVLNDISGRFLEGSTVLLGANGAGKSTLLKVISGSIAPSLGVVRYDNQEFGQMPLAQKVTMSYLPQAAKWRPWTTAAEHVAYEAWLKGAARQNAKKAAVQALTRTGMEAHADRFVGRLSGGERQRVMLAGALVNDPRYLLLDEPTVGLDPEQRADFMAYLRTLSPGSVLVVSTHQTEDLTNIFDNVIVMKQGRTKFAGTLNEFIGYGQSSPGSPISERILNSYRRATHEV